MISRAPSLARSDNDSREVIADPHGEQLVDLLLDLRRRRYGTSHGVGPPSIVLAGLEGTYAVALTAPAYSQQFRRHDHAADIAGAWPGFAASHRG